MIATHRRSLARRLAPLLAAVSLLGATTATHAQDTGATEDAEPIDFSLALDESAELALNDRFFAHDAFGFDGSTFETVANDVVAAIRHVGDALSTMLGASPWQVVPWLLLLAFAIASLIADRRARRWFAAAAHTTAVARPGWRGALHRALVDAVGMVAVPLVALGLSYVPIQGLFSSAPWTEALSGALRLFVLYRVGLSAVLYVLGDSGIDAHRDARVHLRRAAIGSGRLVLVFGVMLQVVATLEYHDDVIALSEFLFRLSMTLLSVRLYTSRRQLIALLPTGGSERYLRFRAFAADGIATLSAVSVFLLGLWTAGFTRAATTILVRSYGLIALFTAGALLQRWFDRARERVDEDPASLASRVVSEVDGFVKLCLIAVFAWALLGVLGLDGPLASLLGAIRLEAGASRISLLGIASGISIFCAALVLSRVYRVLAEWWLYPALDVEMGAGYALNTAVHYFLVVIALGLALMALGVDLAALTVFLGALGVGIGFGLQDMARNFAAGFVLLFGRVVQKGDLITANDKYHGIVEEIGARVVKVRTRDNTELMIPSNELVSSTIINWTHDTPYVRLHVEVGVSYGADLDEVEAALLAAAHAFELSSTYRPPDVWLTSFGDSSVNFELLVWIDATQVDPAYARGKLLFPVWRELKARNIEIPFPQRDIHVRSWVGPPTDAVVTPVPGPDSE